ncbi:MAG: WecB/TagA/CpsF family glycosyltransferase [Hydrococcus sp. Prado102]|jgi:N-acetylglucosaminyldiphosphoundecaprenol N-acetyl-beta-D-mannosaminyltransferase|nr:WecB/TagA/CpsF family glycosyltransferase [Hydrococcus sp. Prado102]
MTNQQLILTKYVLNSPITSLRFDEQIFLILKWARARESRFVCLANVHMLMEAYWHQELASVLEAADLVAPDGMPLVWMLRQMGMPGQDRVAGMDVFLRLCQLSPQCNVSMFFVGSQKEILERMRERLQQEFPNLQIAGMEPLPFRPLTPDEDNELIEKINASGAGLVFVCLGCPKQEYWMMQHRHKIRAVAIGIGAVFALYAGLHKRAPSFVRDSGMEWLYRLLQEPHRLWYRYSQTIPPFIWLSSQQLLSQFQGQSSKELVQSFDSYLSARQDIDSNSSLDFLTLDSEPSKIGEILVRQNLVSEKSLLLALEDQHKTSKKIGEILVEKKYISQPELEYHLNNQKIKLGEILVQNHVLSASHLNLLLKNQKLNYQKLGEIMLAQKIISEQQLKHFLLEQHWRHHGLWLVYNKIENSSSCVV